VSTWRSSLLASWYGVFCLSVLLLAGQHGAFVHDLGHLAHRTPAHATEAPCDLCPAYAQAASPSVGPLVSPPALAPLNSPGVGATRLDLVRVAALRPRNRGPPTLR
jgi:hypothetical protein